MGVNVWAVLTAAASSFLLGGLWYSPVLFGPAWNRANLSRPQPGHPARVFGVSVVLAVAAAFAFAGWLGPAPELARALTLGLTAGLFFVTTSLGINYQFAQRGPTLLAIDGGYHTAQFLLFGLVIGLWH
ncbi:MAG TPA: DUF1761 domain-containing protein [Urbifossiella sp.]|nr:DUF1761 domain-containing protein [Urbifossiella sp.]